MFTPDFKSFLRQITCFVPQITENLASEILKILELILIPLHQQETLPSIPVAWDIAGSVLATLRRWDCTRHPCASVFFFLFSERVENDWLIGVKYGF